MTKVKGERSLRRWGSNELKSVWKWEVEEDKDAETRQAERKVTIEWRWKKKKEITQGGKWWEIEIKEGKSQR